jgi:hypothetical protein
MSKIHSRRAVLAGIATAPALAVPVLAQATAVSEADPIFAAIEHHKASNAAFSHTLHLMGKFEEEHGHADSPEQDEWHRRESASSDVEREACDEMISTVPTSLAGLLALLRYVEAEHARGEKFLDQGALEELVSTTVSALAAIGAVS